MSRPAIRVLILEQVNALATLVPSQELRVLTIELTVANRVTKRSIRTRKHFKSYQ